MPKPKEEKKGTIGHDPLYQKMLRIVDKDLTILTAEHEMVNKKQPLVIHATLSPEPTPCQHCGSTVFDQKGHQVIVKNGTKSTTIRFEEYNHMPTVMTLKNIVFIANHVKFKIVDSLKEKISLTLIGQLCGVSITTVIRVLRSLETYMPAKQPEAILPTVLMVDKFRFHIVKHINAAFNDFRVREGKGLLKNKQRVEAKKIKLNWTLLLKNRRNLDWSDYHTWRSFRTPKSPLLADGMMIDRLLSYSPTLKDTYECFHDLLDAFRDKDDERFFYFLTHLPDHLDSEFKENVQQLLTYEEVITNALHYAYSNGKVEAENTHIKTLKRVPFGFKSFRNMRISIFMINQLIQIK